MSESYSISRRNFGIVSAISGLSGCGFGSSGLVDLLTGKSGGLRILTPWDLGLRDRFAEGFAKWLSDEGFAPVSIQWLHVPDSELSTASIRQLLRNADILLGGRPESAEDAPTGEWMQANLKPIRLPVLRLRSPSRIGKKSENAAIPKIDEIASDIRYERKKPGDVPLALSDHSRDSLSLAYLLATFEDAPDQAAGYARWIRIVGTSRKLDGVIAEPSMTLGLADLTAIDRQNEFPWRGGAGTARTLGIPEPEAPAYWPEIALWRNETKLATTIRQWMDFCIHDGWALSFGPISSNANRRPVFRVMMAEILRIACGDAIRAVWNVMQKTRDERFTEVESYLASRPPWPPASVIEMRTERGFEYAVALAEQLAVDQAQRDWLLQEFGKQQTDTDFRMLESGDNGRLAFSARFCVWLNAEWTAWLRQRCRRAERYLNFGGPLRPSPDFAERKGTSKNP